MVEQTIIDKIKDYCKLNEITDVKSFITKLIETGLNIEKYGPTPFDGGKPKIKEVEVIKEIEVVKEVQVPVEVEVEKEVYITDNTQVKELADEVDKLKTELSGKRQVEFNYEILEHKYNELVDLNAEMDKSMGDLFEQIRRLEEENKQLRNNRDIYGE